MPNNIRPWYRWHVNRWRNSPNVLAMSLSAQGAYRNLIDSGWENGGRLPNKPAVLWRYALASSPEEWITVADQVLAMFQETEDGKWLVNETLTEEWNDATLWFKARSEAGQKGNKLRWGKSDISLGDHHEIAEQSLGDQEEITEQSQNIAPHLTIPHLTTQHSTETSLKPSARKTRGKNSKVDERYSPFTEALDKYWKFKNRDVKFSVSKADGKQLKTFLADHPNVTLEQFRECLNNRARSDMVHSQGVCRWIGRVLEFAHGPLDQYWHSKTANGNGHGQPKSAAAARTNRNLEAILLESVGNGLSRIPVPDVGAVQSGVPGGKGRPENCFPDGEVLAREPSGVKSKPDA